MKEQDSTLTIRIDSKLKQLLSQSPNGMAHILRSLGALYVGEPLASQEGDLTGICLTELEEEVAKLEAKLWQPNSTLSDSEWQKALQYFNTAKGLTHPLMERGQSLNKIRGVLLVGRLQLMLNDWEIRQETIMIRNQIARSQQQNALPPLPPLT